MSGRFSERELEVLVLMGRGLSITDIAEALFLSRNTVKVHQRLIYARLDVRGAVEAVAAGHELGLLVTEPAR